MRLIRFAAAALCFSSFATLPANATSVAGSYAAFGNTTGTGPWTLTSTNSTYSELDFVFAAPVNFGDLTSLSVDYISNLGGIGQGTPRIYLLVDADSNGLADGYIQLHFGPAGSFSDPALGAGNTGNLLSLTDLGRYDLSGIGLSAYTDRAAALSAASSFAILEADLVIDSFGGNDRNFVVNAINLDASPSVPEAQTWAMFVVGILSIGAVLRRRTAPHNSAKFKTSPV